MSKYFVAPYDNYYEKLSSSSILNDAQKISQSCNEVLSMNGKLQSSLSNSSWKEQGFDEIVGNVLPTLNSSIQSLSQCINNSLVACCKMTMNKLVPLLQKLKDKDELYTQNEASLSSLNSNVPSKYKIVDGNNTNEYTNEYQNYLNKKKELEEEISKLTSELDSIKTECDTTINDIKALNTTSQGNIESVGSTSSDELLPLDLELSEYSGKTILYNDVGGPEYGYSRKILTSNGKIVTVFCQGWNEPLKFAVNDHDTLRNAGCGQNALASILSSEIPGITPEKVFTDMGCKPIYANNMKKYVEETYNFKVGYRDDFTSAEDKEKTIMQELSKGNMVMCTVNGRTDGRYATANHWVALVDCDVENNLVYVSDSADPHDKNAEPIDATVFFKDYEVNSNIIYIADDSGYVERN